MSRRSDSRLFESACHALLISSCSCVKAHDDATVLIHDGDAVLQRRAAEIKGLCTGAALPEIHQTLPFR
eukprot:2423796-Amphidinium_carterae.1